MDALKLFAGIYVSQGDGKIDFRVAYVSQVDEASAKADLMERAMHDFPEREGTYKVECIEVPQRVIDMHYSTANHKTIMGDFTIMKALS